MFCPNCGTQNPDTAPTCTKCGFNIKGAAAPKFKGTMLMMNQPPGGPGAVPPPPGAAPPAGPGGAPKSAVAPPSKLKGTMVGVAPPSGGTAPKDANAFGTPAPAPSPYGAPAQGGQSFGSPQGVNPLGGTMVADQAPPAFGGGANYGAPPPAQSPYGASPPQDPPGGFGGPPAGNFGPPPQDPNFGGGFGAPPGGYGGAPPGGPYGAPPQQPGQYGNPQGGFGAPPPQQGGYGAPQQPGGYGAPQQGQGGYGAPQQQGGYGAPQQDFGAQLNQGFNQAGDALSQGINSALGYGQQQGYPNPNQGMMQQGYPGGPMMQQGGAAMPGQHGPKGMVRQGMMVLVYGLLTCGIYQMIWFVSTCNEMKAFLQRDEPNWLKILGLSVVTCGLYGLYWQIVALGPLIQEMQQRAGVSNPQNHGFMYLIPYYNVILMQEELNKVWQAPG